MSKKSLNLIKKKRTNSVSSYAPPLRDNGMTAKRRHSNYLLSKEYDKSLLEEGEAKSSVDLNSQDSSLSSESGSDGEAIYNEYYKTLKKPSSTEQYETTEIIYFEVELKKLAASPNSLSSCYMNIRDITRLISNLKKQNAKIYLDALETNFSHEQMNPLNGIL